jgi:hypothetical protein
MDRLLSSRALAMLAFVAPLALTGPPSGAAEYQFDASIDAAAVASNGTPNFIDNGLGTLRFTSAYQGLQLDNLQLGYRATVAEVVHFTVEAVSYADRASNPLDLTQAYAEVRPFPWGAWRARFKVGAFYAPISLENRLPGWRSAYTISPSAISTWVGEELRTFGAECNLDWLGRQQGHDWTLSTGAAVFGWNEAAGQLMSERGWAIQDRQTTVFGKFGSSNPTAPVGDERLLTAAGANRAGYYVDGSAKYLDTLELRALHYDNRADPNAYQEVANNYPWQTQFNSAGARWTPTTHWTVISQWLGGRTCSDYEDDTFECWNFDAEFLLLSWQLSANRLSGRYDRFDMHQSVPVELDASGYRDNGHAWTLAYQRDINAHLAIALELLQVDSRLNERLEFGDPQTALERQLELVVRAQL